MAAVKAVGLMSGTSLDGVDVALIETDGSSLGRMGPTAYRSYSEPEREVLRAALAQAVGLSDRTARPGALADAEALVTAAHAEAVERFIDEKDIDPSDVEIVGFHGQTVLHRPEAGLTVQIGDGEALARRLGLPVAYDFRGADVAAGGQGAPLVPIYHQALAARLDRPHPVAILNIGGVANITFVDGDEDLIAFDTGPGNALMDDFVLRRTGAPYDRDGQEAARGRPDWNLVRAALREPFFSKPPPKSLDRNAFSWIDPASLSLADGAATLARLTVEAVGLGRDRLPRPPQVWIVAGGGARNSTLMRMLAARLGPAEVATADDIGWSADAIEAQAFAYLAARTLRGEPITFPGTTGVGRPMTGGIVARP